MKTKVTAAMPSSERRLNNLLAATQRALWPLVKLLLHRGIGYPTFADAMKSLFVRVVTREFPLLDKRETISRISVLTGIYRRDVKRIREETARAAAVSGTAGPARGRRGATVAAPTGESADVSLSSMVIAVWTGRAPYIDKAGRPRALPRTVHLGGHRSFEALVRSVNTDVRPRALLDEWLRRGAVTLDSENRVCLNLDVFMANKTLDEKAFYFAQNAHDHIAAIAHNLTGQQPPFLERCVLYGRLTEDSVAELEKLAHEAGMQALQIVNRRAMQLQARDAGKPGAVQRMNFGLYFYSALTRGIEATERSDEE